MCKTPIRFRLTPRAGRSVPTEYFELSNPQPDGAVIGNFGDVLIHEAVINDYGLRYRFVGVASRDLDGRIDVELLRPGEWIVQPGLVYIMEQRRCPSSEAGKSRQPQQRI